MKITQNQFKSIIYRDLFQRWMAVLMSFIGGYITLMVVLYLYHDELFTYLSEGFINFLLTSVIVISLLLVTIARKFALDKINDIWKRLLLCIFIPLVWGLMCVIVLGNEQVTESKFMTNLERYDVLIYYCSLVIPIVLGQIFIKPWKNIYCFITGVVYVAILYIVQIMYQLILVGMIYDDWL